TLVITYTINRSAYVYLADVTADGHVSLLFPSWFESSPQVSAGTHTIPGSGSYTLRVTEPVGTETLYLFAASGPISGFPTSFNYGFPLLSTNPSTFRNSVLATMQSQFASGEWSFDTLSFQVVTPTPTTGTIRVLSSPTNALVKIDGTSVGYTTHEQSAVTPGTHTVEISKSGYQSETRQVTVNAGLTSTVSVTLAAIPTNNPPVAIFTFSPSDPSVGDVVTFDASASADSDGTISSYQWSLGDGTTATGSIISHTFAANNTFTVQLTVIDNEGAQDTSSQNVVVRPGDEVGWISPTAYDDPSRNWQDHELIYDNDQNTYGSNWARSHRWTSTLVLILDEPGIQCDRIRFLMSLASSDPEPRSTWFIEIRRDGEWLKIYEDRGISNSNGWTEVSFALGQVDRARLRVKNNRDEPIQVRLFEFDFRDATIP
ncbi:DUF4384 domain-containing protein, partial [Candidatus Bipolaricaulota bacterium]|nr:DUF4384 domain-containing protein [Candidatus Bipolaricaulota bacterium]